MKIKIISIIIIALTIFVFVNYPANKCIVTNDSAIKLADDFCNKVGIKYTNKLQVLKNNSEETSYFKEMLALAQNHDIGVGIVTEGKRGFEQNIFVNCNNEIVRCTDTEQFMRVFDKYGISHDNRKPRNWPPLLSESKAKGIILSYSNKIGLPKDVEFLKMCLDLEHAGAWTAFWKRTLNGYPYEDDFLSIEIMAIDGEFYSYFKHYLGKPCPTEVKVTKEEAIKKGWKKVGKSFGWGEWDKLKNEYEVKSADLLIVQPNTLLGFVAPWKSSRSRLAWVVHYGLIKEPEDKKRIEIGYHDRFVIKIDAATGGFLGGETGMYK